MVDLEKKDILSAAIRKRLLSFGMKPRAPGEIYVTDIVNCLRRAYFNIVFNANPLPPDGSALIGKALHRLIPDIFGDIFENPKYEYPVSMDLGGGWRLTGKIDVLDKRNDKTIVYEFKFGNVYNTEVKPLYIAQANIYANLVNADEWWLVTIDRKKLIVDIDVGKPDESMFKKYLARAYTLIDAINKNTVPAATELKWACEHCPYNVICVRWREWLANKTLT